MRAKQAATLLRHADHVAGGIPPAFEIILADFNSPVREHYDDDEWRVVAAGLTSPHVRQPLDDGVQALLRANGFRCAYEACPPGRNNFGGRPAPPLTHWTGTVVDFAYVRGDGWAIDGVYVRYTSLSDHLPIIVDLIPTAG